MLLLYSVELSLDAAVAKFGGKWYQASGGVATGGKLWLYIANVVVFGHFMMLYILDRISI